MLEVAPGPSDVDRLRRKEDQFYYPALAVPLGPDDEPVCDSAHLAELRRSLDQHSYGYELHLLVIGYSCLDKTPLDLILKSGSRVASATVVNGSREFGELALERMREHLTSAAPYQRPGDHVEVFDGGFSSFATPSRLLGLVERVREA